MRRGETGAVAIIVALFALVLFGFAALVVDVGNASDVKAQASNAADAGALAGARELAEWAKTHSVPPDAALEGVVEDAVNRTYPVSASAWASCTDASMPPDLVESPTTACIQYASTGTESTVRVRIPARHVPSTFAGIFGVNSISISPVAAARSGQDPGSPCHACNSMLNSGGQPASYQKLPSSVRRLLPDPLTVPPAPPVDATTGCPTGPGRFDMDVVVTGSTPCVLQPGLYLFNDTSFKVEVELSNMPDGGVTLMFVGGNTDPLDLSGSVHLVASPASDLPTATCGAAIPGVAIVLDQLTATIPATSPPPAPLSSAPSAPLSSPPAVPPPPPPLCESKAAPSGPSRSFDLGPSFDITGSVFALDDATTWVTRDGECMASCRIHDDGPDEWIWVNKTRFGAGKTIPTVLSDHAALLAPPHPEHLSE